MAMLGAVGAALGRGAAQFVASSVHNHFHLRETSATRLTTGGADPLLPLLGERLDQATSVDLAIAFAMDSGVAFEITTAGTIIPSIALDVAAAAVLNAGSYFECIYLGPAAALGGSWS